MKQLSLCGASGAGDNERQGRPGAAGRGRLN